MNAADFKQDFGRFLDKLAENQSIERSDARYPYAPNKKVLKTRQQELPASLHEFYLYRDGFRMKWVPKENNHADTFGRIDILPVSSLFSKDTALDLQKLGGEFTFNGQPVQVPVKGFFRPVDFFVDEACVGFFSDHGECDLMYYHDFGIAFYSLKVDFEGYYRLLTETCGFAYWQQALLVHEYEYPTDAAERLKEDMTRLFPHFDYERFLALYDSLKIPS